MLRKQLHNVAKRQIRATGPHAGQNGAMTEQGSLTDLIQRAQEGDQLALRRVFDLAYDDLHRMARARLRTTDRGTYLDTTALVHESYLRFSQAGLLNVNDRVHFFRYAGQVMRSVIVDLARSRNSDRRGGDAEHVTLNTAAALSDTSGADEVLKVHEALEELAALDQRMVNVVELRYFAGFTEEQIAEALGVTDRTVRRDWEKARLLLARALQ
jgi:RNA polymerase sigma factor (TIGR02999 family)